MLDYVNSLNQKRAVPGLKIICLVISCFLHSCVFLTLYLFPHLLVGGYLHQFRGFRWGTAVITDEDMEQWRMVALLEPPDRMNMPSPETLREILGRGNREEGAGAPPTGISFIAIEALETDKPTLQMIPPETEEPEIVIPDNRKPGNEDERSPDTENSGEPSTTEPAEPGTGRDVLAAKPETAPKVELAINTVPQKIPETIQPPAPPPSAKPDVEETSVSNKTAGSSDIQFFGADGFPMDEYRDNMSKLVKSKWLIPSNLKNTFGRTAVVFYIDRNGRVTGLRVEESSGNRSLDNAALSAVYNANPLPPLPEGFPRERVRVLLYLSYEP